jgi:hypothetical protein
MFDFIPPGSGALQQDTVETRPRTVAAWLDRLPFASPMDTARQLVMALYALNRHPLDADDRYALLVLYRPALARAAAGLEALLTDTGVPPHAQQRQVGTLLRELHVEHSLGYKQVLATNPKRFGRASPKRISDAAVHLMAALREVQTACYLGHSAPPAGLWQDMHQLYAFVQASNLPDSAADDALSTSLAYRQALLLALADPPHMSHAELVHARLYLGRFAHLAQLRPASASTQRGFAVRTDGDLAPSHLATHPGDSKLWLDTEALCRHLHETAARLHKGETPRGLGLPAGMEGETSLALTKRLFRQWSGGTQRAFKRYATPNSSVQAVAGVSAIHRLLEGDRPSSPQEAGDEISLPIRDVGQLSAAAVVVHAVRWTVDNDSAAGLALSGIPGAPLNLKVGDPLALRADADAAWSLGAIRWLRMRDERVVELGVERLAPQALPVWVRPLRGERRAGPEAALFVPGIAALKQPDRLLLPRNLYQVGMDAEMWQAPRQATLTFGRCLEHTPGYDLIDFTVFAEERP